MKDKGGESRGGRESSDHDGDANLTPLSASPDVSSKSTEKKPVIIDKEYHEDCGTGEGYWVITYSDGSTVVEQ